MAGAIQDEFAERTDVSRQRRYQLRNKKKGLCIHCSIAAVTAFLCETHRKKQNVRQRERAHALGLRTQRYPEAESYHFNGGTHA